MIRHGESVWNRDNLFTGWTDVPLSPKGKKEAKEAGKYLKKEGIKFDIAFNSVLKRAIDTYEIVLKEINQEIPVKHSWRLNERHYGALQGLNKAEMAEKFGQEQVHTWRRSYAVRPPALTKEDHRWPGHDPMYKDLEKPPFCESLKDTLKRVLPYWKKEIVPELKKGHNVLVSAHGNSMRAIIKHIEKISNKDIPNLELPTGIPIIYEYSKGRFTKVKEHTFDRPIEWN